MERKDDIKNRMCYYFDDIIRARNRYIYSSDVLLDEKVYKENHKNKTSTGAKRLRFMLHKMDGFIKVHNKIRCLVLFDYGWCDEICNNIKFHICEKSGITDSINHNFGRIRIDSYNSLPIEKTLTFHNIVILIKSVVNKYKNEYYFHILLEKGSCKDKSDTKYF